MGELRQAAGFWLGVCCLVAAAGWGSPAVGQQTGQQLGTANAEGGASGPKTKPQPLIQAPVDPGSPFPKRFEVAEFPRGLTWLNTAGPLRLKHDLKGKFVLLDFWTYCCINCMHILPELRQLEKAHPNQLVVIGVHSGKFATERETDSIREAILRYGIEHPVINDADHSLWTLFGVQSWPTLILIDPEGYVVGVRANETKFEELDAVIKAGVHFYRRKKVLDERPVHFQLAKAEAPDTPLSFPGKVLADEASGRLFIADSSHHRIVVASLAGKLLATIGSGAQGKANGDYSKAEFNQPQGMALYRSKLLVADTGNHMIRQIDLDTKNVTTIAGTGEQARTWPGGERFRPADPPARWVGAPRRTNLWSPWDLCVHGNQLYIAMAGAHGIWRMPLPGGEIGPFAGNSVEDIVDGPLLPRLPQDLGFASFAQPSGLTTDGNTLYVADSEGSSIRAVPFDPSGRVRTLVGSANVPSMRLFEYGDIDGQGDKVRLQHALGVAFHAGKVYIADTYNHKLKTLDPLTRTCTTLLGTGTPGHDDAAGTFFEPAGLSFAGGRLYVADTNNHLIRVVELGPRPKVSTLAIAGLSPPSKAAALKPPSFDDAQQVEGGELVVAPGKDGTVKLQVELRLPEGWKINDLAPTAWYLAVEGAAGPVDRAAAGMRNKVASPSSSFQITIPTKGAAGEEDLRIGLIYYLCQTGGEGLCRPGSVQWKAKLKLSPGGSTAGRLVAEIVPDRK